MLINLRNALMSGRRLPYDAEVEYLESSGTQWVDTGVLLQFPISADMTLAMVSPYGTLDSLPVFGSRYGGGSASSKFAIWFSKSRLMFALNYGSYDSSWRGPSVQSGQVVHLRTDGAKLYIDGSLVADGGTVTTSNASNTLTLFQMRDTSTVANRGQCVRYYSCKLYDANGTLVRDFIPVRKGTVGYLYDRVSGKLFGNAGTGDFVLGPDVVPVEYIESHGTEYINTGIVATNAHGVRIDIATAQKSGNANTRIFGTHEGNTRFGFALFGTGEPTGNDAFFGWNAATSFVATIPQRFVASLNYQNDRKAIFNGTTYISSLGTLGSMTLPFYLLNANYGGAPFSGQYVIGKLYGAEVSVGSSITNRYKPVRVGTEGAMMDVLTRRVYRNAGTGAFGYGNDLKYPIPAE